jgi:hypothetical protein
MKSPIGRLAGAAATAGAAADGALARAVVAIAAGAAPASAIVTAVNVNTERVTQRVTDTTFASHRPVLRRYGRRRSFGHRLKPALRFPSGVI